MFKILIDSIVEWFYLGLFICMIGLCVVMEFFSGYHAEEEEGDRHEAGRGIN